MERILFAEDEQRLRSLVTDYLKKDGYEVVEASDGEMAYEAFQLQDFSLLILDIMMPKMDGLEVCRRVREQSDVPIIMLTARNTEFDELSGFRYGADEYISKPFSTAILLTRVKNLLKRSGQMRARDITIGEMRILSREHEVYVGSKKITLTPKEFDLLSYLAANKGITLSREQILDMVWGQDYYGDDRTVDTHIKCLRAKLGSFGSMIMTVRKYGYKLEAGDND